MPPLVVGVCPLRARRAALLGLLLAGCGSSTITSDADLGLLDPSVARDPDPVVTIAAAGVRPQVTHLSPGVPVRFVNQDAAAHRLVAAPELGYGDCPEIAALGALGPGQSSTVTLARAPAICGFKDEAGPANRAFQGLLVAH